MLGEGLGRECRGDRDARHARGAGGHDPDGRVLEGEAFGGRNAEDVGGRQEDVGVRLPPRHRIAADDTREMGDEADLAERTSSETPS